MEHTVFMPDVSSRDWAALIALSVVCLLVVMLGVWLLLKAKSRAAFAVSLLVVSPTVLGLGSLLSSRRPQFTEVAFSNSEMIVNTLGDEIRLSLNPDSMVQIAPHAVTFVSGKRVVTLPLQVTWHLDGLIVDARYLANEFQGRSR